MIANRQIETWATQLVMHKRQLKSIEDTIDALQAGLQSAMGECDSLITFDGKVLATWKSSKGSKRFDPKLLQAEMPEVYERYVIEQPGSRRFLIK